MMAKMPKRTGILVTLIVAMALSGCGGVETNAPAATDTPAAKVVVAATSTATVKPTAFPTSTSTLKPTSTNTPLPTKTPVVYEYVILQNPFPEMK